MPGVSRRRFLAGGLAGTAVAGLGGTVAPGCSATSGNNDRAASTGGGSASAGARYLPFRGPHQTGITHPANEQGLLAAFRVTADHRNELRDTLRALSTESERLMSGEPYEDRDPAYPPLHTGTVGNPAPPADLSVVVSVGASLFDDRYGLADRKPLGLEKMPFLANDRLDPERSHGDLLLTVTSAHEDVNLFALRQLARATRGTMALHWMLDGYNRRTRADPGEAGKRNLMGFIDGTSNLDPSDEAVMDRYVWVQPDDDEPEWAAGGTYHVVRVIRMLVEFWDRTRLSEQESIIGRRKESGAPLGGGVETDVPDYSADVDGEVTPLDAHIRLANPRTARSEGDLIFRSGLSFSRGFDGDGQLDQGLAFVSFQRRLSQFLNTQARLAGEPLEEYILPEGGGFYFALPGVMDDGRFLGEDLFA
ncbi:MAG TPA: Dyp-type peroxidase [Acidimicrobiales bacterium]|nr:Dyp-type peroxidase [Acidimicrobiales bacterium]